MHDVINDSSLHEMILEIRRQRVLLDSDVALLYGLETKRVNEGVKNNSEKFPEEYLLSLSNKEFICLRSKFSTAKYSQVRTPPNAFSEKGLYMLATILKSPTATEATLAIIEAFSKFRELSRNIKELSAVQNPSEQKHLMQKSGELLNDILDNDLDTSDTETTLELNFATIKI